MSFFPFVLFFFLSFGPFFFCPVVLLDTKLYTLYTIYFTTHYTLYTIHYTLYTNHYTLYTIHYTLYTIHYTLYTIHYKLYTIHCTLYTIYYTLEYPRKHHLWCFSTFFLNFVYFFDCKVWWKIWKYFQMLFLIAQIKRFGTLNTTPKTGALYKAPFLRKSVRDAGFPHWHTLAHIGTHCKIETEWPRGPIQWKRRNSNRSTYNCQLSIFNCLHSAVECQPTPSSFGISIKNERESLSLLGYKMYKQNTYGDFLFKNAIINVNIVWLYFTED